MKRASTQKQTTIRLKIEIDPVRWSWLQRAEADGEDTIEEIAARLLHNYSLRYQMGYCPETEPDDDPPPPIRVRE